MRLSPLTTRRALFCVLVSGALFAPLAATAAGGARTILASPSLLRIGTWQIEPYRGHATTYGDAIAAFGPPSRCAVVAQAGISGVARWSRLGVVLYAATLGYAGPGKNACNDPSEWQVDHVVINARIWATINGLRVGDPLSRLRSLYPTASYHGGYAAGVWLVARVSGRQVSSLPHPGRLAGRVISGSRAIQQPCGFTGRSGRCRRLRRVADAPHEIPTKPPRNPSVGAHTTWQAELRAERSGADAARPERRPRASSALCLDGRDGHASTRQSAGTSPRGERRLSELTFRFLRLEEGRVR